jgi:hypothetical protein
VVFFRYLQNALYSLILLNISNDWSYYSPVGTPPAYAGANKEFIPGQLSGGYNMNNQAHILEILQDFVA